MIRTYRGSSTPKRRGGVLFGCLVVLVVLLVIAIIGGIYVWLHWRGWAAATMQSVTTAVVKQSGLPQDQQNEIVIEVQKLGDEFQAGTVSLADMQKVAEAIGASPLLHLGVLQYTKTKYIEPSDMTADEKAAATRSLQRFARGVFEGKIPKEAIDDVIKPVTTLKPGNQWELKAKPTCAELDQFVANAKAKADEAKVPDEAFDLNIAEELKKAINKALGRPVK